MWAGLTWSEHPDTSVEGERHLGFLQLTHESLKYRQNKECIKISVSVVSKRHKICKNGMLVNLLHTVYELNFPRPLPLWEKNEKLLGNSLLAQVDAYYINFITEKKKINEKRVQY